MSPVQQWAANIVVGLRQDIETVERMSWARLKFWNEIFELSQQPIKQKLAEAD